MPVSYQNYSNLPLTLDAHDLQCILRISRAGVYRLMHDPHFPTIQVGSRLLVPRDKFIGWIESKTAPYDSIYAAEIQQSRPQDMAR